MKLFIHPDYSSLRTFVEQLPVRFEAEGESIYKVRNEIKVFNVGDLQVNVKRFGIPHLFNRVAYTWFRKSKAVRAYENAARIIELGFDTPDPVAYIETYSGGFIHYAYFISLQCPYKRRFVEFAKGNPIGDRASVVGDLGVYVARLHQAGVLHKDLSVGNILFEMDATGTHFSLVDLNRMKFCTIGMKKGCKNFNRLRGNEDFFRLLARSYSRTRGFDEDTCFRIIRNSELKNEAYFKCKFAFKRWRKRLTHSLKPVER